ncbi:Tetratricopeptide-like helical domain superfamily, partial [Sesbania bispinosa]
MSSYRHSQCLHLLQGCLSLSMREVKQIHAHAITHSLARFAYVSSRILAFYALSQSGDLCYAETVFIHMPMPNIFDCNSMIMCYTRNSQYHKSLSIFNKMLNTGIRPNSRTFTALAKACVSLSFLEQVHAQTIRLGFSSDMYVVSSVVRAYSKHGLIQVAHRVFDESSNKNVACWTSL